MVARSTVLNPQQQRLLSELWQSSAETQAAEDSAALAPPQSRAGHATKNHALGDLLLQPQLRAVALKVLNTQQWVVTDQNLASGQTLRIQLREDRQFQLLKPLPIGTQATTGQDHKLHPQSLPIASAELKTSNSPPPLTPGIYGKKHFQVATPLSTSLPSGNDRANQAQIRSTLDSVSTNMVHPNQLEAAKIRHYLRHTLPHGQNVSLVIKQFQQVLTATEKMSPELKSLTLEPKAWQILGQLVATLKAPQQLQQASILKTALNNSGVFAEAKQRIAASSALALSQPNDKGVQPSSQISSPSDPHSGDTKVLLSQLLQLTSPAQNPNVASQTNPIAQSPSLLFQVLNQLQGLGSNNRQQAREFSAIANQQIHALTRSALFKITGLQLQQLLQQSSELAPANQGVTIEIPVKIAEQILPLTIYIEEKPSNDQREQEKSEKQTQARDTKASKRWRVFLEFDLEQQGKFTGEINLVENRVQAKFWANNASLRRQAKEQLETLKQKMQASGIEIEDIAIASNEPPKRSISMGYSLVNVTT